MPGASVAPHPPTDALPEHLRLALDYVTVKRFIEKELCKVGFVYAKYVIEEEEVRTVKDDYGEVDSVKKVKVKTWKKASKAEVKAFHGKYPPKLPWIAKQGVRRPVHGLRHLRGDQDVAA